MPPKLADVVVARITEAYEAHADPSRVAAMVAYMRGQFAFLGIPTPLRRTLTRRALAGLASPCEQELIAVTRACWRREEREFQYFACDYLRAHVMNASPSLLPPVKRLITTESWWDTVDSLATRTVGPLVARHRDLAETMDAWIADDNIWLARTALLHQLLYRDATDRARLFRYCVTRASDDEFFIRKAIGWALREYSKTDGDAVRQFVASHDLSPLSRREALAWLDRRR